MPLNVLVVDDSAVMRAMIVKTLQMAGLHLGTVTHAANGQEGLQALDGAWVDLVILDINMPVMDGEAMLEAMRGQAELANLPVIVVSTEGSDTRISRLVGRGVTFVHKPFAPESIRDVVGELLGVVP